MDWYLKAMQEYITLTGRARRREFWTFYLFNSIIRLCIDFVQVPLLDNLFWIAVIVPSIAVAIRRMHDTNHCGWWSICPIANIVLSCTAEDQGENIYGSDPKTVGNINSLKTLETGAGVPDSSEKLVSHKRERLIDDDPEETKFGTEQPDEAQRLEAVFPIIISAAIFLAAIYGYFTLFPLFKR